MTEVKGALRERIATAKSHEQIDSLLKEGLKTYKHASDKTIRKWKKTAELRHTSLNKGKGKKKS